MIKELIVMLIAIFITEAAIIKDLMEKVPGYPDNFTQKVYSGYLNTSNVDRKLHYVFMESVSGSNNKDPVTLWLNGGPGCSSLLGFLQQIGPFYLPEGVHYKVGNKLQKNSDSWDKLSNLLFLQAPAGVGYSYSNDKNFSYNDINTAQDNMDALLNFFANYAQYSNNPFWIAGQSYAGKYIPDLAVLIDFYNNQGVGKKVNLKGILVGNGVMSFENGELEKSQIDYMISREFIDPDILPYYRSSCIIDPQSAGCRYFNTKYGENVDEINPYNVYSYCFYNDSFLSEPSSPKKFQSQGSILKKLADDGIYESDQPGKNGAPCAYFDGLYQYFNAHVKQYNGLNGMTWNGPCAENVTSKYSINLRGSMVEYRYLLNKLSDYHIVLYNGEWDDVVPFNDNIKNIQKLNLKESSVYTPNFVNDQHSGWTQVYSGVVFSIIKGASHQVPQSKRAEAYDLFKQTLEAHGQFKARESMI